MYNLLFTILLAFIPIFQTFQFDKICYSNHGNIYIVDQKTQLTRSVALGYEASISSDSKWIAFTTYRSREVSDHSSFVAIKNLESKEERTFDEFVEYTQNGARFSPQGKKLAFNIFIDKKWQIYIFDLENETGQMLSDVIQRQNSFRNIYLCAWTAKGDSLVCRDAESIYLIDLKGEILKTIPITDMVNLQSISIETSFSLSPDNRFLLFGIGGAEFSDPTIVIYDLEKRSLRRTFLQGSNAQWLPSGKEFFLTVWDKYLADRKVYIATPSGEQRYLDRHAEQISFSLR